MSMQATDALIEALVNEIVPRVRVRLEQEGPVQPRLLTIADAAKYLGRTDGSVRHMISRGRLKPVRIDGRVQLDRLEMDALIEISKG